MINYHPGTINIHVHTLHKHIGVGTSVVKGLAPYFKLGVSNLFGTASFAKCRPDCEVASKPSDHNDRQ